MVKEMIIVACHRQDVAVVLRTVLAWPASQPPAVPDAAGAQHLPPSPLPHRSFLVLCCGVAAAVAGVVVSVKRTRFRSTQWSTFFWADKTLI